MSHCRKTWACGFDFECNRSGTSSVEFALIAPLLIVLSVGIVVFGSALGFAHSLQTAASEAARAAVAGLDNSERVALATTAAQTNLAANVLLNPRALVVSAGPNPGDPNVFTVTVRYDLGGTLLAAVPRVIPVPTSLTRTASIRRGGL